MEEQDEKPPGPLKACAQVSGASLPAGDPELAPSHTHSLTCWACEAVQLSGCVLRVSGTS